MVWLAIGIALPMTLLSNFIVKTLYGSAYIEAVGVLRVYVWAGVFVFLGVASGKWLLTENLQLLSLLRVALGATINILLNIFFIPQIGYIGAAWATVIAQLFAALLFDLFCKKTRKTFIMKLKTVLIWRYV